MKKNKLENRNDGKEVRIVFDGHTDKTPKTSEWFDSKEEAQSAVKHYLGKDRLTAIDAEEINQEILAMKNLPDKEKPSGIRIRVTHVSIGGGPMGFRGLGGLGDIIAMAMMGVLDDDDHGPKEKVCFEMCDSRHGHIYTRKGEGGPVMSKNHGKSYVSEFLIKEYITEEEAGEILAQINESPLPDLAKGEKAKEPAQS